MDMDFSPAETPVGFIGLGVMGKSMAGHLARAGFPLHVFNRTQAKAGELLAGGACWHDSPASLALAAKVIVTMVGFPSDVEEIYRGPAGIIAHARPGTFCLDMTTSKPSLARTLHREGAAKSLHMLDAPVTGGDLGARDARLSIMVGGDEDDFNRIRGLLVKMGSIVIRQGPAGCGQSAKLCNQTAIAGTMVGVCEALAYARKAGLDPATVLQSIGSGAASGWILNTLGPKMLAGDFAAGFYVRHFVKDMGIALEEAREFGFEPPGLALAKGLYERLMASGKESLGTQALFSLYSE